MADEQRAANVIRPEGYVEPTAPAPNIDALRAKINELNAQLAAEEEKRKLEDENRPPEQIVHDIFVAICHALGNPPFLEKLVRQHEYAITK